MTAVEWASINLTEPAYKISLPPECRISWLSAEARAAWSGKIDRISQAVQEAEISSVAQGHRPAAWRTISRADLPSFSARCEEVGLIVSPVKFVGNWEGFIHYTPPGDENVYCIISREVKVAREFRQAFEAGDNFTQGRLLGFPECCYKAFSQFWAAGIFDPVALIPAEKINPYSNPVLRYIGIRFGFHIPCSFDCRKTIRAAEKRAGLLPPEILADALALLNMPVNWNARHGILQVETPLFFILTTTVPTLEKVVRKIRPKSVFWPAEAPEAARRLF